MKIKAITNSSKEGTLKPYWPGWLETRFPGHFAQIGTLNTLRLSSSVRDVARMVMGKVPPDIERMCKAFIRTPQGIDDVKFIFGYDTDEGHVAGSIETDKALQEYIFKYPDQWAVAKESLALWRSKGKHAAGFVISNEPIDEFIPTVTIDGVKVLDFTGPQVEACGGIKMDFLVVNAVKDVQSAIRLIQERHLGGMPKDMIIDGLLVPGVRIVPSKDGKLHDLWDLPQDREVFEDLDHGKTETVFQFDTNSARQWLKHFEGVINSVNDMAIFTALDRPGPLDYFVTNPDSPSSKHNMLVEFSRRAKGLAGSADVVKELDELCKETKGIMVYQESLMKVYQYFTDCTLAEAEEFRGNVGKKKRDKIDKAYALFMERAAVKVSKEAAQAVWDSIITWSKYGFNACMTKDTVLCLCDKVSKEIQDVEIGDVIWGLDKNWKKVQTKVVNVYDHGFLPALEIEFDDGYVVSTSINHKFLTTSGQVPLYEILAKGLGVLCDRSIDILVFRKIVHVRFLGLRKMYDLEVDHPEHNFLLPNGIITSNSHAKSYTTLSYACLWLKHYYPLEWWCSVLKNATKDEINDKFWMHCSYLVLLPDISLSKGDWAIEGDKIRAPVSVLKGVGETAHKQLLQSAPYSDLKHFCQSIVDYKKNNTVIKEKTEKDGSVKKGVAWGRSAIDIGKVWAMMSAGCMDSFFDKDMTISAKLDEYHRVMKELHAAEKQKYTRSKKAFPSLDCLGRYQAKKSVLPIYGEDLRPALVATGLPEFLETDGKSLRIKNKVFSKISGKEEDTFDPVIGAEDLIELEVSEGFEGRYVKCGIVCYLEKKEQFNWGKSKEKDAYKLFVEFGGIKRELVLWPDFNGSIPLIAQTVEEGSIIVLILNKNTGRKDFAIRGIEVVRKPLGDEEKVDSE